MEPVSIDNLSILYQSADFIVVNKHWDVRIDSKMWYEKLTLQRQLKYRFPELADPDTYYGFRFCHQLDFSTSGALCVALNKAAAGNAYKCFKDRLVTKAYLALVRGHVQEMKMTIRHAIGKNTVEGLTHMMCIEGTEGCENPKPCQSELTVLEHGLYSGDPVTKVLLQPLTGRTHQLRVHCSAIGHPVVGDFTYSFKTDSGPYRMMLHAYYLRIPTSKERIESAGQDVLDALLHLLLRHQREGIGERKRRGRSLEPMMMTADVDHGHLVVVHKSLIFAESRRKAEKRKTPKLKQLNSLACSGSQLCTTALENVPFLSCHVLFLAGSFAFSMVRAETQ
ncbi:RNA pseudouridylate synthase domain-containing protein 1 isoform X2 [Varanus komodoensis]|uniref:RNA pseudouridylate synthase domain-containing protein 1 isoform X2 n=1 Tax=Varanus komodoensis TaxID=61221 RepID=UPI001CF7C34A|nr:RNA pseudouridylate synthase domain-containing protein 1 isoform X2 [Varanus komodoensis]